MKITGHIIRFTMNLCVSLWLLTGQHVHALVIDGLYYQEIPVQGQSDAERLRAYREGLAAVIVKVTGQAGVVQNPIISQAIRDAQNFVQEVTFRTTSVSGGGQSYLNVSFDQEQVDTLLGSANIPVWDRNRPSILLWLSVQGADGQRELLSSDSEHEVLAIIREFSQVRGVPILIPLMDFEDRRSLPDDVAWSLDEQAIRNASVRYGADSVLSGRVLISPGGDLVGLWQFLFRERVEVFDSLEQDLAAYMYAALERVSMQLATHFGIDRSAAPIRQDVTMRVEGVEDATAYVDLLAYLQELAVVERVSASLLDGTNLELTISLTGSTFLFTEFISLGRDLVPGEIPPPDLPDAVLHYRWVR